MSRNTNLLQNSWEYKMTDFALCRGEDDGRDFDDMGLNIHTEGLMIDGNFAHS